MSDDERKEPGPGPTETPAAWLPPRLRDRLERGDEPPPSSSGGLLGVIGLVLILALAGAGIWWTQQRKQAEARTEARRLEAERATAVADSLARIATLDSMRTVARAESTAAFLKLPPWKQKQILAGSGGSASGGDSATAGGGAAENLDETGNFAVDAGTFLFEDAAQTAVNSIRAGTRLEVRAAPVEEEGSTSYHVYVGKFSQRGAAADAADQLFAKGTITQAKVVKLDAK